MTTNPERLSDEDWPLTDKRIDELIAQCEATPCPQSAYCEDETARVRFALHIIGLKALRELRELRALLATPMPCGWPAPVPASPVKPTMVLWEALDCDGGNALDADEAIALGAALVRAGIAARGGR